MTIKLQIDLQMKRNVKNETTLGLEIKFAKKIILQDFIVNTEKIS